MTAFSSGRFTLTLATPSSPFSTRSTEATHAAQVMPVTVSERARSSTSLTSRAARRQLPLTFIEGDASAPASAQPADAFPALAAFGSGVEAFHFAVTIATLGGDPGHDAAKNVVNIKPWF